MGRVTTCAQYILPGSYANQEAPKKQFGDVGFFRGQVVERERKPISRDPVCKILKKGLAVRYFLVTRVLDVENKFVLQRRWVNDPAKVLPKDGVANLVEKNREIKNRSGELCSIASLNRVFGKHIRVEVL